MSYKEKLDFNNIPKHVAIIMDGNGRWAKLRNRERTYGHQEGVKSVKAVVEAALEIGVKYLTIYAFSSENWARPKEEVQTLMKILVDGINDELDNLNEQGIRLHVIGEIYRLQPEVQQAIKKALESTKKNDKLHLIVALSYSGRDEIISAVKKIAEKVKSNQLEINNIDQTVFSNHLYTKDFPDPDLLIRTSGEIRISNFLLWQIAYTELYFTKILWPDFRKEQFFEAIFNYQQRERRFGKTSEQIKKERKNDA